MKIRLILNHFLSLSFESPPNRFEKRIFHPGPSTGENVQIWKIEIMANHLVHHHHDRQHQPLMTRTMMIATVAAAKSVINFIKNVIKCVYHGDEALHWNNSKIKTVPVKAVVVQVKNYRPTINNQLQQLNFYELLAQAATKMASTSSHVSMLTNKILI